MATREITKTVDKLRQELGRIDTRRREILKTLKESPEHIIVFTEQTLKSMVDSKTWFEKNTTKGSVFSQLVSFNVDSTAVKSISVKDKKPIITASLGWNQYSEENPSVVTTVNTKLSISTFNEIEPQILNGFKRTMLSEKEVKVKIIDIREKALTEEIKKLRLEKKNLK